LLPEVANGKFLARHDWSDEHAGHERVPGWARVSQYGYSRFDGGPVEVEKAFLSGWDHMRHPDSVEACAKMYDDSSFEVLERAGFTWIWITWSVGFSKEAESRQQAMLADYIKKCHERGIRVTAYHSLTNMFVESMFEDVPESESWCGRTPDGTPTYYGAAKYSGEPTRIRACLNEPAFIQYLLDRVTLAIEAGVDAIDLDNTVLHCACHRCQKAFAEYTQELYGQAYSIPGLTEQVKMDAADVGMEVVESSGDDDFVSRAFNEFSLRVSANGVRQVAQHALNLKPDVLVYSNCHEKYYLHDAGNAITTEDGSEPGMDSDVKMRSNAGLLKSLYAMSYGWKPVRIELAKRIEGSRNDGLMNQRNIQRAILEPAAYQCTHEGYMEGWSITYLMRGDEEHWARLDAMGRANKYVMSNKELFMDVEPVSSMAVVPGDHKRDLYMPLDQRGFNYNILLPRDVCDDTLEPYATLVLWRTRAMSDEMAAACKRFVERGGRLICLGDTGTLDELLVDRKQWALADLFAGVDPSNQKELTRVEFGKGQAAYLPVDGQVDLHDEALADKVSGIIKQADRPTFQVSHTGQVCGNLTRRTDGKGWRLYLVNYAGKALEDVHVSVASIVKPGQAVAVTCYGSAAQHLTFAGTDKAEITIPTLDILAILDFGGD